MAEGSGRSSRRRWEVAALVAAGAAIGLRAAARRAARERARRDAAAGLRQPSWVGRRLDPSRRSTDPGLRIPTLLPGRVVMVPGRGEVFVRYAPREGGVPIVLLHGWMATADLNWFLLYDHLAEHHTVVAPDLRGHGRGIRGFGAFSIEDCADDVAGVLGELGVERAVIVGYSMGGPVALELWRRHGGLVAGLVLEATGLQFASTPVQQTAWRLLRAGGVLLRWPTGRLLLFRLGGGLEDLPAELLSFRGWADGEFRRNDPMEMVEAGRALARYDAQSYASTVDVPTAVVVTTRDRLVPPEEQRALARATRATVFEFDADHSAVAVRPAEFAAVTLDAIAAVAGPAERDLGLPASG
ncbi:MAG TPA: alpha/beta hydrolase [Actinomycetota bacterium]|nr:alpha/beta hydrolase [Actinomycetota bacterium]